LLSVNILKNSISREIGVFNENPAVDAGGEIN